MLRGIGDPSGSLNVSAIASAESGEGMPLFAHVLLALQQQPAAAVILVTAARQVGMQRIVVGNREATLNQRIQNGRGSSQWIVRYTLNQGRRAMADNDQLKPNDFPVHVEQKKIVKPDGKELAEATTPTIAEDIADRLNAEEEQREEDRWA
jgi:hypothetical protein